MTAKALQLKGRGKAGGEKKREKVLLANAGAKAA
jgi:hypothetical protein